MSEEDLIEEILVYHQCGDCDKYFHIWNVTVSACPYCNKTNIYALCDVPITAVREPLLSQVKAEADELEVRGFGSK